MNRRVFFALFPPYCWILLAIGIALTINSADTAYLGRPIVNLALFLLFIKVAIILHELGHLLTAKLVGGTPKRISLGHGHQVYRTKIFNIRLVVHSKVSGGQAYAIFQQNKFFKLRFALYVLGGVIMNTSLAVLCYILWGFGFYDSNNQLTIDVSTVFILANAALLTNLIPFYSNVRGIEVPSDGMSLLKLPFEKSSELKRDLDLSLLFDAHELMEEKEYKRAWDIYTNYLQKYPDNKLLPLNLSIILLKTGEPEKSVATTTVLLEHIHEKTVQPYSAFIYNQLAWAHLVLNNIDDADHYSSLAYKTIASESSIRGTRGSVMIERGQTNEGMNLLFDSMDFNFVNSSTLCAAIYLALAYHNKGFSISRDEYLRFIQANEASLESDERILYQRVLTKITEPSINSATFFSS